MKYLEIESFAKTAKALANAQLAMSVAQYIKDEGKLAEKLYFPSPKIEQHGNQLITVISSGIWVYKIRITLEGEGIEKIYYRIYVEKYHPKNVNWENQKWIWKSAVCRGSQSDFVCSLVDGIFHDYKILRDEVDEMQQKDRPTKTVNVSKEVLVDE